MEERVLIIRELLLREREKQLWSESVDIQGWFILGCSIKEFILRCQINSYIEIAI